MPTTITSAGVTFNDTTTLTSANIGTAQLVNGSVTAAKLGTTEQKRIAKAWVNFDGTLATPITPRASFNVSSVTKNGTGDYTVNFATAMADANYSASITPYDTVNAQGYYKIGSATNAITNTSFRFINPQVNTSFANSDASYMFIQIFGN